MDSLILDPRAAEVLARLRADVDELRALAYGSLLDEDLVAVWQQLETVHRRLASVDHAVIGQVRDRHLDFTHGATSVVAFARQALRISIREAKIRVAAAEAAGPRCTLSGEVLLPVFPEVAAAQAEGAISPAHAALIVRTIEKLPDAVQKDHGASAEALLVEQARSLDPDQLAKLTQRLADTLDPDGCLPDYDEQQRRRELRLIEGRGSRPGRIVGELTDELFARLRPVIDLLAKPLPATDGAPDSRTRGQREHDALLELVLLAERSGNLSTAAGVTTTLILTAPANDWNAGTGLVRTGHGALIPTPEAKRWISGDTRVVTVALNGEGAIHSGTDARRLFTENQRLAMIARDKGCAFPGCDRPPQYTQAHHVDEHSRGGPTGTDNGCLLCHYHHRNFGPMGWRNVMINHVPHFIPPQWIDAAQKPIRNTTHDPATGLAPV